MLIRYFSILQITTSNPTGSHTVPPATTFATSPVCLTSSSTEARMTVIGISKSEGIPKAQQDRSIWCWRGDDSEKEVLEVSLVSCPPNSI
jgi:hypothetical protein